MLSAQSSLKPAVQPTQNFRVWLQGEFTDRCRKNSRYSLRAFSRLLEMEASSVSQILAGKRNASRKVIGKIADRLSTPPDLKEKFLVSVPLRARPGDAIEDNYLQLTNDAFAVISDWYHYALLELTFAQGFRSEPRYIARTLGITPTEATVAVQRLERLGLLERKKGKLVKTTAHLSNGLLTDTGPALRELQRQILGKALAAIDQVPAEEKDITSMTMAIDPARIPEARVRIRKFRRELCAYLEGGGRKRVYNLGVQLYPVSQNEKDKS